MSILQSIHNKSPMVPESAALPSKTSPSSPPHARGQSRSHLTKVRMTIDRGTIDREVEQRGPNFSLGVKESEAKAIVDTSASLAAPLSPRRRTNNTLSPQSPFNTQNAQAGLAVSPLSPKELTAKMRNMVYSPGTIHGYHFSGDSRKTILEGAAHMNQRRSMLTLDELDSSNGSDSASSDDDSDQADSDDNDNVNSNHKSKFGVKERVSTKRHTRHAQKAQREWVARNSIMPTSSRRREKVRMSTPPEIHMARRGDLGAHPSTTAHIYASIPRKTTWSPGKIQYMPSAKNNMAHKQKSQQNIHAPQQLQSHENMDGGGYSESKEADSGSGGRGVERLATPKDRSRPMLRLTSHVPLYVKHSPPAVANYGSGHNNNNNNSQDMRNDASNASSPPIGAHMSFQSFRARHEIHHYAQTHHTSAPSTLVSCDSPPVVNTIGKQADEHTSKPGTGQVGEAGAALACVSPIRKTNLMTSTTAKISPYMRYHYQKQLNMKLRNTMRKDRENAAIEYLMRVRKNNDLTRVQFMNLRLGITKNEEEQFIRLFCVRKIKRLINERVYALSVKIGHQRHKQVQLQQQRVAAYITIAGAWKRYRLRSFGWRLKQYLYDHKQKEQQREAHELMVYRLKMAYRSQQEQQDLEKSKFHINNINRLQKEIAWSNMQVEIEKEKQERLEKAQGEHTLEEALAEQKRVEYERQLVFEKLNRQGAKKRRKKVEDRYKKKVKKKKKKKKKSHMVYDWDDDTPSRIYVDKNQIKDEKTRNMAFLYTSTDESNQGYLENHLQTWVRTLDVRVGDLGRNGELGVPAYGEKEPVVNPYAKKRQGMVWETPPGWQIEDKGRNNIYSNDYHIFADSADEVVDPDWYSRANVERDADRALYVKQVLNYGEKRWLNYAPTTSVPPDGETGKNGQTEKDAVGVRAVVPSAPAVPKGPGGSFFRDRRPASTRMLEKVFAPEIYRIPVAYDRFICDSDSDEDDNDNDADSKLEVVKEEGEEEEENVSDDSGSDSEDGDTELEQGGLTTTVTTPVACADNIADALPVSPKKAVGGLFKKMGSKVVFGNIISRNNSKPMRKKERLRRQQARGEEKRRLLQIGYDKRFQDKLMRTEQAEAVDESDSLGWEERALNQLDDLRLEAIKNKGLHMGSTVQSGDHQVHDVFPTPTPSSSLLAMNKGGVNERKSTRLTKVNAAANESIAFIRRIHKSDIEHTNLDESDVGYAVSSAAGKRQQADLEEYRLRLSRVDLSTLHDSTLFRMSGLLQIQLKATKDNPVVRRQSVLFDRIAHQIEKEADIIDISKSMVMMNKDAK